MLKLQRLQVRFSNWTLPLFVLAVVGFLTGCIRESKIQQIRNGVENVDQYAKEIDFLTSLLIVA